MLPSPVHGGGRYAFGPAWDESWSAGLNRILARFLGPVICRLFPSSPKGPQGRELVSANVCANLLGLGKCGPLPWGSRYPAYGPVCKARRGQS